MPGSLRARLYNSAVAEEHMDVAAVLAKLNTALRLQYRSALQYTLTSDAPAGREDRLARRPSTAVAELDWTGDPAKAVQWLIETESEAVAALKDVISDTGQEGRSEALEHVLEHLIMRKQHQVDFLIRARREP